MVKICQNCSVEFTTQRSVSIYCSKRCSSLYRHANSPTTIGFPKQKRLEQNPGWKGDKVGYRGIHSWVVRNWGKASQCESCSTTEAKVYDWSNKTGQLIRDRENWQEMCRSCHQKYDYANGMRKTRKSYAN